MIYVLIGLLGLCLGSFVNALVWRLSQQLDADGDPKELTKKQSADLSITKGRSMCPRCKHTLAWYDLVPVFSWVSLGGKCRYCKKPISPQYPLTELATSLLFIISFIVWPFSADSTWVTVAFISWLAILAGLVALVLYDAKYLLLPNRILFPLIGIAVGSTVVQFVVGRPIGDVSAIFWSILIAAGIFWVLFQTSGGRWIGGGDVKFGLLAGLLLGGASQALLYLFIASFLGLLYSLPLMLTKRLTKASKVPFGPFLIAALIIVVLWGDLAINWYSKSLLGL